jgi:hypothetical protein
MQHAQELRRAGQYSPSRSRSPDPGIHHLEFLFMSFATSFARPGKIAAIAAAALMSVAGAAHAQEADTKGFYIGVDAGFTTIGMGDGSDEDKTSYGALAGYQFNKYLSAEAYYMSLGRLTGKEYAIVDGVNLRTYGVAVKGSYPVGNNIILNGRLGVGRPEIKLGNNKYFYNESETKPMFGAGIEYQLNKSFSLRLDYTNHTSDDKFFKADSVTLGANLKF